MKKLFIVGHSDSGDAYLPEGVLPWPERTRDWLSQQTGERWELVFSIACGVLTAAGWAASRWAPEPRWALAAFIPAYVVGAWFPIADAMVALRTRRLEIDFLMLFAAAGAAALGSWFEGSLLLFLFTFGHSLEGFAMRRAREAIAARMAARQHHFMPPSLLRSQFETLETPTPDERILVAPVTEKPGEIVTEILSGLSLSPGR